MVSFEWQSGRHEAIILNHHAFSSAQENYILVYRLEHNAQDLFCQFIYSHLGLYNEITIVSHHIQMHALEYLQILYQNKAEL